MSMAANPRGSMRPNGRSPPFLAIGLCVALVILGFNYWSLSARNGEQANEIALMESELRLVNAKKTSSEKRGEALSDKVADLEKEISSQKEIIANKMSELQSLKQDKEECSQRVNDAEGEKVTINDKLDVCEAEKSSLKTEAEQLKGDAETLKNKQCEASDCQTFSQQSREQTLRDINRVAGNAPLIALYKMGGDVGQFADQLKELAAAAQNNVPIQGGANMPIVDNQQQQQQQTEQQQQPAQQETAVINPPQPDAVIPAQGGVQTGEQGGIQNEASQTDGENKESGVPQPDIGSKKDVADETANEGVDSAQVARPDVKEFSENGDGNDGEAQLFPPDQGDGNLDDDEDDDDYDDEDDDDTLRLGDNKEDEDYDYDDDEDDYRYNDNLDDQRGGDVQGNDNTIDQMYQQDKRRDMP